MRFKPVQGANLERIARYNGLVRKQGPWWWPWWPLRESDAALRRRVLRHFERPDAGQPVYPCGGTL